MAQVGGDDLVGTDVGEDGDDQLSDRSGSDDQHRFVESQPLTDVRNTRTEGALDSAGGYRRRLGQHRPLARQVIRDLEDPGIGGHVQIVREAAARGGRVVSGDEAVDEAAGAQGRTVGHVQAVVAAAAGL